MAIHTSHNHNTTMTVLWLSGSGLSSGEIVGIVFGVLALALIVGGIALGYYWYLKRRGPAPSKLDDHQYFSNRTYDDLGDALDVAQPRPQAPDSNGSLSFTDEQGNVIAFAWSFSRNLSWQMYMLAYTPSSTFEMTNVQLSSYCSATSMIFIHDTCHPRMCPLANVFTVVSSVIFTLWMSNYVVLCLPLVFVPIVIFCAMGQRLVYIVQYYVHLDSLVHCLPMIIMSDFL